MQDKLQGVQFLALLSIYFPAVVHRQVVPTATLPVVAVSGHVLQLELELPVQVRQLK